MPTSKLAIAAVLGLVLGGLAAFAFLPGAPFWSGAPDRATMTTGKASIGGPFALTDHTGKAVTDRDFRGRFMLVFFGFRNCPDICPAALQTMSAALDAIGPKAERLVPLFITLDPERDTPERLAAYVASFHPKLVGLTGTAEQVRDAAKAYRVYFKKTPTGPGSEDYTVDHTSILYLMGPDGNFVAHFAHGTSADVMAEGLRKAL